MLHGADWIVAYHVHNVVQSCDSPSLRNVFWICRSRSERQCCMWVSARQMSGWTTALKFVMIRLWRALESLLWFLLPSNERKERNDHTFQCQIWWKAKYYTRLPSHQFRCHIWMTSRFEAVSVGPRSCLLCMHKERTAGIVHWKKHLCKVAAKHAAIKPRRSRIHVTLLMLYRCTNSCSHNLQQHSAFSLLSSHTIPGMSSSRPCHSQGSGCMLYHAIPESQSDVMPSLGVKGQIMPSPGFRGICMAAMLAWWLCRWWCWLGSRFMPILPWP